MAEYAESDLFNVMLGSILAISAYMLLRGRMKERRDNPMRFMAVMTVLASISAGIVSSFFGIGGGVVIVPFMVLAMGMKMMEEELAVMSQPALLVITFVDLMVHGSLGHPDMYQALLLAGGFAGGLLGVRLSGRLQGRQMRIILSVLIFSAAARLFWEFLEGLYQGGLLMLHRMASGWHPPSPSSSSPSSSPSHIKPVLSGISGSNGSGSGRLDSNPPVRMRQSRLPIIGRYPDESSYRNDQPFSAMGRM